MNPARRRIVQAAGGGLAACAMARPAAAAASRRPVRVLVVGGGYGGATAAKYLKHWGAADLDVTLVDADARLVSCPLSNLVLSGSRRLEQLTLSYDGLRRRGVRVMRDTVTAIDPARRRVRFAAGPEQAYDRIVIAPGVEFMSDQVQGLDAAARHTVLHAWKAGPETAALRRQLEAMPDGGVYVLAVPRAPYRCPPGPYERACQVAHYFEAAKPRSKVVVLDANEAIVSKQALFEQAFAQRYAGLIEYRPDSRVTEIDARGLTAVTELGERVRADVLNVVPPQRAGAIARQAGLVNVNDRWCDVDWLTMESTAAAGVHVLGDATLAAALMPKSGHMANQHGKAAAAAIIETLRGRAPPAPMMANTCYSFVEPRSAIHIASVHRYVPELRTMQPVPGAGGLSAEPSALEAAHAMAWARNIWSDMLT